jgi:hypothetical protein
MMARRTRQPHGQSRLRLPAAPLLAAIAERVKVRSYLMEGPYPDRVQAIEALLPEAPARAYYRAVAEGSLTVQAVEQFCDLFGWHPRELYGDAYDRAAFAGMPADFDPWDGLPLTAADARAARFRLLEAISHLDAPARDLLRAYVTMGLRLDVLAALFRTTEVELWAGIVTAGRTLAPRLDADLAALLPEALRDELAHEDEAEGMAA